MSNQAKNWQKGFYTVEVRGKNVVVSKDLFIGTTDLGHPIYESMTGVAHCAPEDKFSLSMGVALAMDRLNKQLAEANDKIIKVGDKVKIKDSDLSYITYVNWIVENVSNIKLAACYNYNAIPKMDGDEYIVKAIASWKNGSNNMLAYIQRYYKFNNGEVDDNQPCYLIRIDGLEKV